MHVNSINRKLIKNISLLVVSAIALALLAIWALDKQEMFLFQISEHLKNSNINKDGFQDQGITSIQGEIEIARKKCNTFIIVFIFGIIGLIFIAIWIIIRIHRTINKPIQHTIEVLADSSDKVTSASVQVSSVSQGTAEETSNQVSSLEEALSFLKEMHALTKKNESHATQAFGLIHEGKDMVLQADMFMAQLLGFMDEIFSASEAMYKIIKSIDDIAFQTKILSINASIEAARAGKMGAAFSVVADEVRNLAIRSENAAEDTSDLLVNTIRNVKNGAELLRKTNRAFQGAVQSVTHVTSLVQEITHASHEQSQKIDQTYNAVVKMYKVTHQSAINAEMSASASVQMLSQAERLREHVDGLRMLIGGYDKLKTLVRSLVRKDFSPGDYLIHQGEKADEAFIIEKGLFHVKVNENPNKIIAILKPGDIVGEVALVMDVQRTANVIAASADARVIVIRKDEFLNVFKGKTDLSQSILNMIKKRMQSLETT